MVDLRHLHSALTAIGVSTKAYKDKSQSEGEKIQARLKEAQSIENEDLRARNIEEVREIDVATAKGLREGVGAEAVDIVFEDTPFEVLHKQWKTVDGWMPNEEARIVAIAIDDALNSAQFGRYVDGEWVEEVPTLPKPIDITDRKRRPRRR